MTFPFRLIDLTHALSPNIPSWSGGCGFRHEVKLDYKDSEAAVKFRVQQIKMHAGIGTHMDAPSHCVAGGDSIADLDIHTFLAPCCVISKKDGDLLCPKDIEDFENTYGLISPQSFVIIHTGWDQFWDEPERYRKKFPTVSQNAAEILLRRDVVGLGIDTLSPDSLESGYPVHAAFLSSGKYIVENVAHAGTLPPVGSYSLALPMKIVEGTEAPVRLVAFINRTQNETP